LQVTMRTTEDPAVVLMRHWKEILKRDATLRKPPKRKFMVDEKQSISVYSGAPSSARRGRMYDKGRESLQKDFENCVRYELVLRAKQALGMAFTLFSKGASKAQIALTSLAFFATRGCSLRSIIECFPDSASLEALKYPGSPSTLDRKCQWLQNAVRPSVLAIVERIGLHETRLLLGLQDSVLS